MGKKTKKAILLERATLVSAFIEPALSLPQAWQIYSTRSAEDISLFSWIGWQAVSILWLFYGVHKKDVPILVYHGLFIIVQSFVIVGIFLYK